jgi:hypothetical protein
MAIRNNSKTKPTAQGQSLNRQYQTHSRRFRSQLFHRRSRRITSIITDHDSQAAENMSSCKPLIRAVPQTPQLRRAVTVTDCPLSITAFFIVGAILKSCRSALATMYILMSQLISPILRAMPMRHVSRVLSLFGVVSRQVAKSPTPPATAAAEWAPRPRSANEPYPRKSVFFASTVPPKRTLEFLIYIEIALNKCLKLNLASFFLFARV